MPDARAVKVKQDGGELNAHFFVEVHEGKVTIYLEGRWGPKTGPRAKNPQYATALELLFSRLKLRNAVLVDLRVENSETQALSAEECRVDIRNQTLPLALASVEASKLRLDVTASLADAGRPLSERTYHHNSGAWKGIRLYLDVPGFDPNSQHAAQLQRLLRLGPNPGLSPYDPEPIDPQLTQGAYEEALHVPEGATDTVATTKRRTEQRFLRQSLLQGKASQPCALCGRPYPPGFLVCAHIKKRSACSEAERKDAANIVMLACRFGCDALYEAGVVYVDASGVVRSGDDADRLEDTDALGRCVGKGCLAWREGTAAYFAWHRAVIAGV